MLERGNRRRLNRGVHDKSRQRAGRRHQSPSCLCLSESCLGAGADVGLIHTLDALLNPRTVAPAVRSSTPTPVHGSPLAQVRGCSANRAGAGWGYESIFRHSGWRWVPRRCSACQRGVGAESVAWERPRLVGRSRGSLARSVNEGHKGRFRMQGWC